MMSAPLARTSSGRIALTVAAVPTGMKAGVRISPRGIAIEAGARGAVGGADRKGEARHQARPNVAQSNPPAGAGE